LLGVEADFDGLTNTNSSITPDGFVQHDAKLNFLSTVRGRVGLTFDRLLVYGTGGVAFTQSDGAQGSAKLFFGPRFGAATP
jgi:outer membrane immunogenic protein